MEGILSDVAAVAWLVVFSALCILACLHGDSGHYSYYLLQGARRCEDSATRIAKQALRGETSGMGHAPIGSDLFFYLEDSSTEESEEAMNYSPETVLQLIHDKFPGMEHYWVSDHYESPVTPQGRHQKNHAHKAHVGYVYCGFVDSLTTPIQARCWRSVSYSGLVRHVMGEDPNYHQDENAIPETRRRFKI